MQRSSKILLSILLIALIISALLVPTAAFADSGEVNASLPSFSMTAVDGTSVTNSYDSGKTRLFVFYGNTCPTSQSVVSSIANAGWADNSDLSIIAAALDTTSLSAINSYANNYGNGGKDILFCQDTNNTGWSILRSAGYSSNSLSMPAVFIVDSNNKIRYFNTGNISAAALKTQLSKHVSSITSSVTNVTIKGYLDYDYANEALALINSKRAASGYSKLTMNSELISAAMRRAAECSIHFNSARPNGESFTTLGSSHSGNMSSQYIATKQGYPQDFVNYIGSNIITDSGAKQVGIGCFYQGGNMYWTLITGTGYTSAASTKTGNPSVTYSIPVIADYLQPKIVVGEAFYGTSYDIGDTIPTVELTGGSKYSLGLYHTNPRTYDEIRLKASCLSVTSTKTGLLNISDYTFDPDLNSEIGIMMSSYAHGKGFFAKAPGTTTVKLKFKNSDLGFSIPFKITSPLDTPAATLSIAASSGKPTLTWKAISGAKEYEIYRATSKTGTYTRMMKTTGTSYTNSTAVPGKTYYYKVRALNSNGVASAYSTVKSITCDCARPVTSITVNKDSGKPKLTWSKVEGASKYEVYRSTSKNGTYSKMLATSGTTYTNSTAVPGTNYYYKVKAICGLSSYGNSAFSTPKSYYCDCARPVTSLTINKDSGKPKLTWGKVSGATKYEVWRSTSKNGTYKKMLTTSGTTYTNSTAVPGTNYYYKVKAICGKSVYGNSAFSTPKSYVCDCARPVVSISRNSSTGKPRLTWQAVEGASKYEIWRSTSKNGTYERLYTQKSTTYTNTTAKAGKTYYYKVKAICGKSSYGNSAFSYVDSITSK